MARSTSSEPAKWIPLSTHVTPAMSAEVERSSLKSIQPVLGCTGPPQ